MITSPKIVVAGTGVKAGYIAGLVGAGTRHVYVLSAAALDGALPARARQIRQDPATADLKALGLELGEQDFAIIVEDDPPVVRRVIANLRPQVEPENLFIITADATLADDHPELHIRTESSIYREELREMMRRARTRKNLAEIRQIARASEKVVVMLWGNPDPDSMASSLALGTLVYPEAKRFEIAYTGELTRPENIAMARVLDIRMRPFSRDLLTAGTAVITVDAQPAFFTIAPPLAFDVVIDHHPRKPGTAAKVVDVRPTYGATSTIMTEYFTHTGRKIPRRVATALLYGLKTDTNNLTRNVSAGDIEAYEILRRLADENAIRSIELEQLPADVLDVLAQAIAKRRPIDDCLIAFMGELSSPDYGVYIADLFIRTWGVAVAVVGLRHADKLVLIFRSDGLKYEIGRIVERVFTPYGTAGGHRTMARAEIPLARVVAEAGSPRDWAIESWLLAKLSAALGKK